MGAWIDGGWMDGAVYDQTNCANSLQRVTLQF